MYIFVALRLPTVRCVYRKGDISSFYEAIRGRFSFDRKLQLPVASSAPDAPAFYLSHNTPLSPSPLPLPARTPITRGFSANALERAPTANEAYIFDF